MDVSSIGNRDGLILKELRKAHFARALRLLTNYGYLITIGHKMGQAPPKDARGGEPV